MDTTSVPRRHVLKALVGAAATPLVVQPGVGTPTKFQLACMTLPYAEFPLERALQGIASAGYRHVAWGTTHQNSPGRKEPVLDTDASPATARKLGQHCRSLGLEPVMMFSRVYVAALNSVRLHRSCIAQAAAAEIPFVLTFGAIQPGQHEIWIDNLKKLGPAARSAGVTLVIKQHGGNTATGADCARIVSEVGDPGIKICYDAGNVLDYKNDDPIADIKTCWQEIRAFCIKDHRNTPRDEDCGPGFGEIDHYKLLAPVLRMGITMPLAFENIFQPLLPRPTQADAVDALALRARQYLEAVLSGLQRP